MTSKELILINSDKVRRDSSLMAFYIECFTEAFGYKPKCTGCTFSTDWNKLLRFINKGETPIYQKQNTMSSFKIKKTTNTIYAYKANGKTIRRYDNKFDEDFVIGFLTNGSDAEIEQRKKLFSVLPDILKTDLEVIESKEVENNSEIVETAKEETKVVVKRKRISKKKK